MFPVLSNASLSCQSKKNKSINQYAWLFVKKQTKITHVDVIVRLAVLQHFPATAIISQGHFLQRPCTMIGRREGDVEVVRVLVHVHVHGAVVAFGCGKGFDLRPAELPAMNAGRWGLFLGVLQHVGQDHVVLVDVHVAGRELLQT